jgi:hypothetical protein
MGALSKDLVNDLALKHGISQEQLQVIGGHQKVGDRLEAIFAELTRKSFTENDKTKFRQNCKLFGIDEQQAEDIILKHSGDLHACYAGISYAQKFNEEQADIARRLKEGQDYKQKAVALQEELDSTKAELKDVTSLAIHEIKKLVHHTREEGDEVSG